MAECDWAILCDYSFLDVNRKVCLIGIFNQITVSSVPAVHHQAAIALKLTGEPNEKVPVRVEVTRPPEAGGGIITKFEADLGLAETGSGEVQLNIAGLPLPDFGIYGFNVYVSGDLSRTVGFSVVRANQK